MKQFIEGVAFCSLLERCTLRQLFTVALATSIILFLSSFTHPDNFSQAQLLNPSESIPPSKHHSDKAVVLLTDLNSNRKLNRNVRGDEELQNFLVRIYEVRWLHKYRILIMYTGKLLDLDVVFQNLVPNLKLEFIDINELYKAPLKYRDVTEFQNAKPWGLGYRSMCEFWIWKVFSIPQVRRLKYYMRLDSDSHFNSSYDVFEEMEKLDLDYGWYRFEYDMGRVTQHLNEFMRNYISSEMINPLYPDWTDLKGRKSPMFYNNFEICKVSFFSKPEVKNLTQSVLDSEGVYEYRWGDAVIRFFQVTLFSNKIKCFNDIDYFHRWYHQCFDEWLIFDAEEKRKREEKKRKERESKS